MMEHKTLPKLTIVMGVSGSGKSSVAMGIASKFNHLFVEADDFHSGEAISMMSKNIPLSHHIRQLWIDRICQSLTNHALDNQNVVLAYSGLIANHRNQFRLLPFDAFFIYLEGSYDLIADRLVKRKNHFVDEHFLQGQLQTMEQPTKSEVDVFSLGISSPADIIISTAVKLLITQGYSSNE